MANNPLEQLKAEVARTKVPARKPPSLADAPGNVNKSEHIPDAGAQPRKRQSTAQERVQKNLSILKSDAARMTRIAKHDKISQAQLITLALDAYEAQKAGRSSS